MKPILNLSWVKEAPCNMLGDQQQGNAKYSSPLQQSLQFHWLQLLYIHFTQDKTEKLSGLTSLIVSLSFSQSTKKTLPRKMTVCSMTVPQQLCESKCCNTLRKCLLEVGANPFFLSGIHRNTTWNLFDFNVMSPTPFFLFFFFGQSDLKRRTALVKRLVSHIKPCLNSKSSLKPKIRQVLFVPVLIQRCYTTQKTSAKKSGWFLLFMLLSNNQESSADTY